MATKRLVVIYLLSFCGLWLSGCNRDESDWGDASKLNTADGYSRFLTAHPKSPHYLETVRRREELALAEELGKLPREFALMDADKDPVSRAIRAPKSISSLQGLSLTGRQALLQALLNTRRRFPREDFTFPSAKAEPPDAGYGQYWQEIPTPGKELASLGMMTVSGNIDSKTKDESGHTVTYRLERINWVPTGGRMKITGGMLVACRGQVAAGDVHYSDVKLKGVRGSLALTTHAGAIVLSTELPADRVIIAETFYPGEVATLWPTAPGSVYAVRGKLSSFFPGIAVEASEDAPMYFGLTGEHGLVYLAGRGKVIKQADKRECVFP